MTYGNTPLPPPPNQQQQQQLRSKQAQTSSLMYNSWAKVVSRDSTQRVVLERIRELKCQVLVYFKLEKGQADFWAHKDRRNLTLKANEIINSSDMLDLMCKPAEVLIWGAHRMETGKYLFFRPKYTDGPKLAESGGKPGSIC